MSPIRTCIGCRATLTPDSGLRVTRGPGGSLAIGRSQPGRGAWLCRATAGACARAATKRRGWPRALRAEVSSAAVEELLLTLEGPAGGVGAGTVER